MGNQVMIQGSKPDAEKKRMGKREESGEDGFVFVFFFLLFDSSSSYL